MSSISSSLSAPLWVAGSLPVIAEQHHTPVIACSDLQTPGVDGATVVDFKTEDVTVNGTDVCSVDVYVTHGEDKVRLTTFLPRSGYTGRFQGVGGAGMVAGVTNEELAGPAAQGFVAVTTDAGRPNATYDDDTWARDDQLLLNFAYLSVHEMTVAGKALAEQFYGQPVAFSYWNGCSNGGRQGFQESQRYPADYNGILAAAPGFCWDRFLVTDVHPYLLEVAEQQFPPACVWETITAAAIEACDELDGGKDGVISDPFHCEFDAASTIGRQACNTTITEVHARMWNEITDGPRDFHGERIWGGLLPGTNVTTLAGAEPFFISKTWIASFVEGDPDFDVARIGVEGLAAEVAKSGAYRDTMGSDHPDLAGFRDAGGKLLTWHGLADQILPAYGTLDYRARVEALFGGNGAVNEFYRLFLAPGVEHCGAGPGAAPSEPLQILMDWVENGNAPDVLPASGPNGDRNLCLFPKEMVYSGEGDLADASSWTCI